MIVQKQTQVSKDLENKKVVVVREFDAPVQQVWEAWTNPRLLDLWWAPKPWRAETSKMDFREGGVWLYCMVGPEGERQWCYVGYETIKTNTNFTGIDAFCDENGNINNDFPVMHWNVAFSKTGSGTSVRVDIKFSSVADLDKILEMGFEEGFTAALGNLDEVLESKAK